MNTSTGAHEAESAPVAKTSWVHRLILGGLIIMVGFLAYSQIANKVATNAAEDTASAVQQQAKSLADQVAEACAKGGATAADLGPACAKAAEVQQSPPPLPPGPSTADIERAVADYLRDHPPAPGRGPTVAEITDAVAVYMAVNPPASGRPPTGAEIAAAVETYLRDNPPRAGADGATGPPPTAEEIAAAVTSYLDAHPPPAGPQGPAGPAGPVCPDGYELRPVVAAAPDGGRYTDAVQCVRPESSQPPKAPPPLPTP